MKIRIRKRSRRQPLSPECPGVVQDIAVYDQSILSIADAAGRILYVNDMYCKATGYSREELIGKTYRIVQSGVHPVAFYEDLWKVIDHNKVWRGVFQNRTRSGMNYWVHTTIIPVWDKQRREKQFLCTQLDVTGEIEREYKRLAESGRRETERLLGSVIHEIGNPLTTVKGFLQQYNSSVMFRQNQVGLLLTELMQIEHTIQGLLEWTRIHQNRNFEFMSLGDLAKSVLESFRKEESAAEVSYVLRSGEEQFIRCIPGQIRTLLHSLIIEELRAIGGRGCIEVTVCQAESRHVCLRIASKPEAAVWDAAPLDDEEDEEPDEAASLSWLPIIRNQILTHHEAELRRSLFDGGMTEVRFPCSC
ncbi:MAG: domain S-box protein [Paenibacillaceae bacterium]|nr:domain S-box protein [Paenibacillaceae bacterium]